MNTASTLVDRRPERRRGSAKLLLVSNPDTGLFDEDGESDRHEYRRDASRKHDGHNVPTPGRGYDDWKNLSKGGIYVNQQYGRARRDGGYETEVMSYSYRR